MAKVGRKASHYETSTGDIVQGLIKQKDGRWRILATGKRFTAETEAQAVARFYRIVGQNPTVAISVSTISPGDLVGDEPHRAKDILGGALDSEIDDKGNVKFIQRVDEGEMIEWAIEGVAQGRRKPLCVRFAHGNPLPFRFPASEIRHHPGNPDSLWKDDESLFASFEFRTEDGW